MMLREITVQLRRHAPFTAMGTASGIIIMLIAAYTPRNRELFESLFWGLHPLHILISAMVTTAMYRVHSPGGFWRVVLIGYFGSVGIATLSDCVIPYIGELLLDLPNRSIHLGFIEKWWLVNPLALVGVALGWLWPRTRLSHAMHVLISTWASLLHIMMAQGDQTGMMLIAASAVFLFLAVWVPCCTSDIVFPLLWVKNDTDVKDDRNSSGENLQERTDNA